MHEDDQCESKESLAQLNKSIINDQLYYAEAFEMNLLKPPGFDVLIGKFAEVKKVAYLLWISYS